MSAWDFQDLFRRRRKDLLRRASRRVASSEAAADIVQDAFVRMLAGPTLEQVDNQVGYAFKTVDNLSIDYLRRETARTTKALCLDLAANVPAELADADAPLRYRQTTKLLVAAIGELPPRCRQVFLLSRFDGLSYREIADRLGITVSMVEKHMMKALGHCRDRLDRADD